MNKQTLYTELSIQIATLEAKVDKVLQLLMQPEVDYQIKPVMVNLKGQVEYFGNNPLQWPNESYTDYLKRIGQYNEPQSEDEQFLESYK